MVRKIHPIFILFKGVCKGIFVAAIKPVPAFKVVAHRRAPIAKTGWLHLKCQCASLCPFNAKCPVKPIALGITKLIFKNNCVPYDFFYANISANEITMDAYHCQFLRYSVYF